MNKSRSPSFMFSILPALLRWRTLATGALRGWNGKQGPSPQNSVLGIKLGCLSLSWTRTASMHSSTEARTFDSPYVQNFTPLRIWSQIVFSRKDDLDGSPCAFKRPRLSFQTWSLFKCSCWWKRSHRFIDWTMWIAIELQKWNSFASTGVQTVRFLVFQQADLSPVPQAEKTRGSHFDRVELQQHAYAPSTPGGRAKGTD